MANGRHIENHFGRIFCFPTAFWASTSGGFRIVSDTLVTVYTHFNVSTCERLQLVQNRAAHLLLNVPPRTPSPPLLQQLHWLSIEARVS